MGRHSTYTQEIADEICERLGKGEPLAWICEDERMPAVRTVNEWASDKPPAGVSESFAADFAHGRARGFDAIAADALRIADTTQEGVEVTIKPDGSEEVKRGDMLGHRKLRIETRLKLLAKWDPKRYGDKVQTEHSGSMGVTVSATPTDESL